MRHISRLAGAALATAFAFGAHAQEALPVAMKAIPHELSPWSMFMAADIVVKAVMVGLAFASLATWTVFIAKTVEISRAKSALRRGLAATAQALSVAEAHDRDPGGSVLGVRPGAKVGREQQHGQHHQGDEELAHAPSVAGAHTGRVALRRTARDDSAGTAPDRAG